LKVVDDCQAIDKAVAALKEHGDASVDFALIVARGGHVKECVSERLQNNMPYVFSQSFREDFARVLKYSSISPGKYGTPLSTGNSTNFLRQYPTIDRGKQLNTVGGKAILYHLIITIQVVLKADSTLRTIVTPLPRTTHLEHLRQLRYRMPPRPTKRIVQSPQQLKLQSF
jgi:hypothetical protein